MMWRKRIYEEMYISDLGDLILWKLDVRQIMSMSILTRYSFLHLKKLWVLAPNASLNLPANPSCRRAGSYM